MKDVVDASGCEVISELLQCLEINKDQWIYCMSLYKDEHTALHITWTVLHLPSWGYIKMYLTHVSGMWIECQTSQAPNFIFSSFLLEWFHRSTYISNTSRDETTGLITMVTKSEMVGKVIIKGHIFQAEEQLTSYNLHYFDDEIANFLYSLRFYRTDFGGGCPCLGIFLFYQFRRTCLWMTDILSISAMTVPQGPLTRSVCHN